MTTPSCLYCGKRLCPNYTLTCADCGEGWFEHGMMTGTAVNCPVTYEQIRRGGKGRKILKGYGRHNLGLFCSDKHAIFFAELAAKAGYRVTKAKGANDR